MTTVTTVAVLGPLRVRLASGPVDVTPRRLRALLATLAVSAGAVVSIDCLGTAIWGDRLPDSLSRTLRTYVTRLRAVLGDGHGIVTSPAGYMMDIDPDRVDAWRMLRLLDEASTVADPNRRRALLGRALALWRGAPFEGVDSAWLEHVHSARLTERYLSAVECRMDLDLADGRHGDLVAELSELTARHPLREPMWLRRLVVLDRCGRQAEALACYERVRRRIAGELGADPGPDLRRAHGLLLAGRPLSLGRPP